MAEQTDHEWLKDLADSRFTYKRGFIEEKFPMPEEHRARLLKIADRLIEAEREAGHWRSVRATVLEQLK